MVDNNGEVTDCVEAASILADGGERLAVAGCIGGRIVREGMLDDESTRESIWDCLAVFRLWRNKNKTSVTSAPVIAPSERMANTGGFLFI